MKQIRYIFVWLCLAMVLPLFAQQKQVRVMGIHYSNGSYSTEIPSEIDSIKMNFYSVEPSTLLSKEGRVDFSGYAGVFSFSPLKVYDLNEVYIGFSTALDPISAFPSYNVIQTEYDEAGQLLRASEVASGLFSDTNIRIQQIYNDDYTERYLQISLELPGNVVLDRTNYSYTVMVSFPQGFLKDYFSGVESEAVTSSFNSGAVEGAYWRVEQVKPIEPVGVLKEDNYVWSYNSALGEQESTDQENYPGYISGEVTLDSCTPTLFENMDGKFYMFNYFLHGVLSGELSIVSDIPPEQLYALPVQSTAEGFRLFSGSLMADGLKLTTGDTGSIVLFVMNAEKTAYLPYMTFNRDSQTEGLYLCSDMAEPTLAFLYMLIDNVTGKIQGWIDMGTWAELGEASIYETQAARKGRSATKRKLSLSDFRTDGLDRFPELPPLKKFAPSRSVEGGTAPVRGMPIQEKPYGNELKVFRR